MPDLQTTAPADKHRRQAYVLVLISITTILFFIYWEGRIAQHLFWDEGFLWYGVQRVMLGEVPIRDFMSADPGRYYWAAAIMTLFGENSIISLRLAAFLFQSIGLFVGLWIITPRISPIRTPYILIAAVVIALWMYPLYKVFDSTASILLIASMAFVLDRPSYRRHFFSGLVLGLLACISRNHGLYGVIGGVCLLAYLKRLDHNNAWSSNMMFWIGGITVGYLPMILMIIFIPGFANSFWESISYLFEYKATNLPLPIPWPWLIDIQQPWSLILRNTLIGLFFVSILLYGFLGLAIVTRSAWKKQPVQSNLLASAFLALPYTHYSYSRADIYHLALGIFPFLIGFLGFTLSNSSVVKRAAILGLFLSTLFTILPFHPGWVARRSGDWLPIKIGDSPMIVDPGTAGAMKSVAELVASYGPNGREFLVAPFWPGAYAAFQRKSPMWENYALFPRSDAFQRKEIASIKKADPAFVLIFDYRLDGRDEYLFQNSHPLIDRFIRDNFVPVTLVTSKTPFRTYVSIRRSLHQEIQVNRKH